jgi:deazaflavin-dependent oxidoreductase (nitroreductase family)
MVNRLFNAFIAWRKPKTFRGGDLLLLTTTGRKTGKERTTPLLYLEEPGRWVAVASNGGADWEPGWWLNLKTGSTGMVRLAGRSTVVTGHEITGAERDRLWPLLNEKVFDYASYQAKVERQLAVVALVPAKDQPASS